MRSKQATRRHAGNENCPNCGRRNIGNATYCPDCGQENHALDLSFGHLIGELLESTVHVDSKIFRTLDALLFRPGSLTMEYVAGRRQRYVPPIRLYVFASVLFFFLLSVLPGGTSHSRENREANRLKLSFYAVDARVLVGLSDAQIDSVMAANRIKPTAFNRYVARKLAIIEEGGVGEFAHLLLKTVSYMMFILMPIFGLFVYLLHRRRALFYVRGLVYSVHIHSFIFLMLSIFLVAGRMIPVLVSLGLEVALALLYLFLSLRRLFREPVVRTLVKTIVLSLLYLSSIFVCFMAVVLTSIVLF